MNPTTMLTAALFLSMACGGNAPCQSLPVDQAAHPRKAAIMVVGAYHFVSKANVHNIDVDDPLKVKRQAEIDDLVKHLARYRPTKIILEQTSGTSDLERHYREFLAGTFVLPPSENYQIGFRLAKSLGHRRIYLTNARTDFDYPALITSAKEHHEEELLRESDRLSEEFDHEAMAVQEHGTVLDMYRFFNREDSIDKLNAPYMLFSRVGGSSDFAGAKMVASWHLRNLEMFAQMTQLVSSSEDRVLILYGAGHGYLLRDFIRQSPDLVLVDPQAYLR